MIVLGYGLAVLIGITLGLLGGGGAILTVPVLVYVLGVGVRQAVPMSLVVVGLTSLVGVLQHSRGRNVNGRALVAFAPAAIAGSVLGSMLALRVSARLQLTIFAVVLLVAAGSMLWGARKAPAPPRAARPLSLLAGIGGGVGLLTGLVGVGGGFLYVPSLATLAGLDMKQAVGTSLALITVSCAAGVVGYLGRVPIDWRIVAGFSGLAFVGVGIGAALVPKVSQATLRRWFAGLLLIMGVLVLIRR
ncbi:MAG TPA: sulfite exporter TauE/SafE family protein [Gemmatimonadales bacterium]